jgi:hypothetical protein
MRYWKKELPETAIHLPIGKPLKFDYINFDYGYLATEDGYINTELGKCASRKSGGITEIDEVEYLEFLEKKSAGPSLVGLQRQRQSIGPNSLRRGDLQRDAGVVEADKPHVIGTTVDGKRIGDTATPQRSNGLQVNRNFVKPKIGRIPSLND